jgi:hypothetical protein
MTTFGPYPDKPDIARHEPDVSGDSSRTGQDTPLKGCPYVRRPNPNVNGCFCVEE